ncbi:head-tail connector protein [Cereibacter changlensis]|uniref:Gp6-like head-tail connector protein n=1 Tax=Cereibacter changlensis TaxID=402884 RepID=A0A2W7QDU8_9RHOB|nr:head-tail connector protein [Cereibacter changlensis]PZX46353.1 gp6-like head-tail connector protein [Cereibacter changlensis]
MTAHTPVALLKAQLNLDHDLDEALLAHKLAAADAWIAKHTGQPFPEDAPADLTEAALQLAAFWYEQREAASFGLATAPVPFGVYELLQGHRDAVTGHVPA